MAGLGSRYATLTVALGEPVSMLRRLGTNSAIYAATNLLQKGATFLLLPLYTLYLDPGAFGVLAVVTSINGLLGIAFTLALNSAVTRFYFDYQNDPTKLAEFWGSIFSFVLLLSLAVGGTLLVIGDRLLAPLIGHVAFWPYVALGVLATFFQPFFSTFLALLQTRNEAGRYALVSVGHFLLLTALTIAFVVFLGWGARGALIATLVAAASFFALSLWLLRRDMRLCLKWQHLRTALGYSLPHVPHLVASQVTAVTDRLVINASLGTATAGVYYVGAMIAMVVEVAAQSVNRAYVPLSMEALKRRSARDFEQMHGVGALIVAGFCLLGASIAAFGRELLWLLASPAFAGAVDVVPILVFAGVANAMYYLFVSVLFFDLRGNRLIPLCTLTAAALNVALVLTLVPRFGLAGAAWGTLAAQLVATVLVAIVGRRYDPVRWDYGRYALAFVLGMGSAIGLAHLAAQDGAVNAFIRVFALLALAAAYGILFWGRPLILGQAVLRLVHRRSGDAAALFFDTKAVA